MQTTPSLKITVIFRSDEVRAMNERKNERKQPSQLDQILAALENGDSLTALDALEDYGCSRLASRITDLKRMGYPVASRMVTRRNRYGRLCRVAEYYMEC